MRRIFLIFALLLVPSLAFAGWNIKQQDDGSTVWENSDGNTVPVGGTVHVTITDVGTSASHYVVTHKAGSIKKIYLTLDQSLSADTGFVFHISSASQAVSSEFPEEVMPVPLTNPANITDVLTILSEIITADANTGPGVTFSATVESISNTVVPGDVIVIQSNGLASTDAVGEFTIVIE